ncbi:hypothetical protein V6N11_048468 [Hibiscus sabdariffa]|uniref:Uncharacterized protein n=1 Tax=Hibiscus sabdariffa TaxID=183260 RepID=A0ABR2PVG1_9ROSI
MIVYLRLCIEMSGPINILLDGDFGVAKVVDAAGKVANSMSVIAGSWGYIAPGADYVLDSKLDPCFKEEIYKVLNIGLLCTSPLPINRPSMKRVVKMVHEAGAENQLKGTQKDGESTPYYYEDASDQASVA